MFTSTKTVLACLLGLSSGIYGSGPVAHIYLAEKYLACQPVSCTVEQRRAFLAGSLWPDRDKLGLQSRDQTHEHNVLLADIKSCHDMFQAGCKLHCFIDEHRNNLITKSKIYDVFKNLPPDHLGTLLKLVEDELWYSQLNREEIREALKMSHEQQLHSGLSDTEISQVNGMYQKYFAVRPSQALELLVISNRGFLNVPADLVAKWQPLLKTYIDDPKIKQFMQDMLAYFDQQFTA
jgi:hypothetical protein